MPQLPGERVRENIALLHPEHLLVDGAHLAPMSIQIAEAPPRLGDRLVARHAERDELLDASLEMELELVVDVALQAPS